MSSLTLSQKSLLPKMANDLFDTGNLFTPRMWDFDNDLMDASFARSIPSVNIIENNVDFKIDVAAPGLDKKDFKISVENNILSVSAEKSKETKTEKENFTRREFSYSNFTRSFRLPENCLPEKIDARYESGILHLSLPKKEVSVSKNPRIIKVS
jgi:HSP20 family protein